MTTWIGIPLDYNVTSTYASVPWYALRANYAEAVTHAGGIPVFLPYDSKAIPHYKERFDGFLLAGGDFDHPPAWYDELNTHSVENLIRSTFERSLLESLLPTQKPILGICGGMQLMNILAQGTLYQDVPTAFNLTHNPHQQTSLRHEPHHKVISDENAKIYQALQEVPQAVNSTHHQAIKKLGQGLKAISWAEDGIIEAFEDPNHPFYVGVQWHPEYLGTSFDQKLFQYFIKRASLKGP